MLLMVIETFAAGKVDAIYTRLADRGRLLPAGVVYIDSWVAADRSRCYQLMEAPDEPSIREWTRHWDDLVSFEIVSVFPSIEMQARLKAPK